MNRDFYSVLNLPRDASKEEIRKAYLCLARQYHPDLNKEPNARNQFEEINQAYAILFDDESRALYNLYFEESEEEQQSWWWQYTTVASIGLGICAVLAGYGLVTYTPTLEREFNTLATMISSKKTDFELLQMEATHMLSEPKQAASVLENTPQQPLITDEFSKTELVKPPSQNDPLLAMAEPPKKPEEGLSPLEQTEKATVPPSTRKPSARHYEVLAFYSLLIGDLTEFKNALKLACREDSSHSELNALDLSLHQLESAKLPPERILRVLRSLVLHKYSERLLPAQFRALKAYVQNDEA
ncbi:MAG: DnaJ domain-containing protein [Gloeobacterales cyanobacterium]